ncbi:NAD-dependent epimerase/dehydratase family protein [Pinibacter aurantiacus]|uniref:NAD-dependent epimerase/dehydratase family protein n=1 Tax=Pinibacter aurantiacus TaxID=2851599 RepID=A0A9E2SFL5_9BACT|nr:NAD-dependent epimerase/dehydratase family protein [Pinibacter aurantiacus]MBV4360628.1 NAD-dependent epimerase/dehydratase family protein [Pinibacter aurantiacus]
MTQVILGVGGDIGNPLAKELKQYTSKVRLVSRHPEQINGDDELLPADLLSAEQADKAVAGASVAYLIVGLKYDLRIWQKDWPTIINNVINACLKHGTKLVFFDNIYMYDKSAIPHMTEESPLNPPSKKGKVRLQIVEAIRNAISQKGLQALIARSADFYGPGAKHGLLNVLVLDPLSKNKRMSWQSNVHKTHSFTYTPDAAKATAILGNTDSAYGQTWHLPTSSQRWTGEKFITYAASMKGAKTSYNLYSPLLLSLAGLFDRTIKELVEMQYQNNQDYFFDSQKFCKAFNFTPTSYEVGMKALI